MIKRPILIACIGYILGIIYGLYFNIAHIFFILICIIYIFLKKNIKRYLKILIPKKLIILLIIFEFVGFVYINYLEHKYNNIYKNVNSIQVEGIIKEIEKQEYFYKYIIKVKTINNKKCNNIKFLMYSKTTLKYGDYIKLIADYQEPRTSRNYNGFSYKEYLKQRGIYGILKPSTEIKILCNIQNIDTVTNNLRELIKTRINDNLSSETSGVFTAILFGDRSNISDEINTDFKESNMAHILAVSGAHVTYIIITVSLLLKKTTRKSEIIVTLAVLLFFMMITGFTLSVVRACIMAIVALIAKLIYRKSDIYNNLAISCLIILLLNPYNLFNIGFQLSYLGTLGIIMLGNKQNKKIDELMYNENKVYLKKIKAFVINMVIISISVQIFIFPIIVINYNIFSFSFLISGIVATPIFSCIMIIGIVTIILGSFGNILFPILEFLINILLFISKFISNISFLKFLIITPNIVWIISYYVLISVVLFLRSNLAIRLKRYVITKYLKLLAIVLIIVCVLIQSIQNYSNMDLNIYFIDVGQGDSTLIVTPNKKTILIDGGGDSNFDIGRNTLVPYLLDRGINKIDYMMISHFDNDHCDGLMYVLKVIKVKNILISKQSNITIEYENFINLAKSKNTNILYVKSGDVIKIEKELDIQILYPEDNLKFKDLNNNSIVAKLKYKNFSMLFTGDIEKEAEHEILRKYGNDVLKSTILKIAHHGSKTSSSKEFLEAVKPKIALIGVGEDNNFGHPNVEVLNVLTDVDTKVYRTDQMGEIVIRIGAKGINIQKNLK